MFSVSLYSARSFFSVWVIVLSAIQREKSWLLILAPGLTPCRSRIVFIRQSAFIFSLTFWLWPLDILRTTLRGFVTWNTFFGVDSCLTFLFQTKSFRCQFSGFHLVPIWKLILSEQSFLSELSCTHFCVDREKTVYIGQGFTWTTYPSTHEKYVVQLLGDRIQVVPVLGHSRGNSG